MRRNATKRATRAKREKARDAAPNVEEHLPLVRAAAKRLHGKLPRSVTLDELVSAGSLGLIDAARSFDAARGVKFATYCAQRVRGAMLDWLRRTDPVPRLARSRQAKQAAIAQRLTQELGRVPTDEQLADAAGYNGRSLECLAHGRPPVERSLFAAVCDDGDNEPLLLADTLECPRDRPGAEACAKLIGALPGISQRERILLVDYYANGRTMREAADGIGVSESYVSMILSAVAARLREQFGSARGVADLRTR